jgi:hypothetical protein
MNPPIAQPPSLMYTLCLTCTHCRFAPPNPEQAAKGDLGGNWRSTPFDCTNWRPRGIFTESGKSLALRTKNKYGLVTRPVLRPLWCRGYKPLRLWPLDGRHLYRADP